MLRSVLVPLDGAGHSQAAIELGILWAQQCNAHLTGIGIVDQPTHPAVTPTSADRDVAEMQGHWKDLAERVKHYIEEFAEFSRKSDVSVTGLQSIGVPSERILLESQRHDLVVMSHHFETPQSRGDTFMQVLQNSPRPVVAVPGKLSTSDTVVIAYDGSTQSARALQLFVATGLYLQKSVHVVTIQTEFESAQRLTEMASEFLTLYDIHAELRPVIGSDVARELLQQSTELHAGLVVMGAHRKAKLQEFFLGSVTKTILSESQIPLFLYH